MLKLSINEGKISPSNFNKKLCEQEIEKYFKIIRNKKSSNLDVFQDIVRVRELRKLYLNLTGNHYKPIIMN